MSTVRICVISEDHALRSLLSSTLGTEFSVSRIADDAEIDCAITASGCDVVILDLDSHHRRVYERILDRKSVV